MTSPGPDGDGRRGPDHLGDALAAAARMRQRAAEERRRAARAGELAGDYESQALAVSGVRRELRARMAALHRQVAERHLASAVVHELHAVHLERWRASDAGPAPQPAFITAVAEAIGVSSVAATVHGRRHGAVLVTASDATAQVAQELEAVLGEGPGAAVAAGGTPVLAAGQDLRERWPLYGPAVAQLGVRAVAAVTLQALPSRLGALCVYGTEGVISAEVAVAADRFAAVLAQAVLAAPHEPWALGEADYKPEVHQAVGMVAARRGCGVDDAQALLQARAFASGRPAAAVARQVLRGETRLW